MDVGLSNCLGFVFQRFDGINAVPRGAGICQQTPNDPRSLEVPRQFEEVLQLFMLLSQSKATLLATCSFMQTGR